MMNRKFFILMLMFISQAATADSVVTLDVVVTNGQVNVRSSQGNGLSVSYDQSGRYLNITDNYPDMVEANLPNTVANGINRVHGRLERRDSVFVLRLTGQKYKRSISLAAKMIRTKVYMSSYSNVTWGEDISGSIGQNCERIFPAEAGAVNYNEIISNKLLDYNLGRVYDCSAKVGGKSYPLNTKIIGGYRESILDMSQFVARATLPPDIYRGTVVYTGDAWVARGNAYEVRPKLTFDVTIEKKPFFSGLQFSGNVLNFLVNNHNEPTGVRVSGHASTSFNLLGVFSEQDKIKIDARSNNNFRLAAAGGATIPYSVKLTYRGESAPLVIDGKKQSATIISPWIITQQQQASSVDGLLTFDFSTPASQVHNGMFSDNFTLMAELVL